MKRFFENDNDETWTQEALELERKVQSALNPIFQEYISEDYSVREIAHIMQSAVGSSECEIILGKRLSKTDSLPKLDKHENQS